MKELNDEELRQLMRAVSPRRQPPAGLDARIMARVRRSARQRLERRRMLRMFFACIGLSASAASMPLLMLADGITSLLPLFAATGVGAMTLSAYGDCVKKLLRDL